VDGTLAIHSGSAVDAGGTGYLKGRTWDNAPHTNAYAAGSHGGYGAHHSSYAVLAPYGDFMHAYYPGAGGYYNQPSYGDPISGGGSIRILAAALDMNQGRIKADGMLADNSGRPNAAGGSIDIQVGAITDNGTACSIHANGGGTWTERQAYTGGGGRIAIRYTDSALFDWTRVSATGGPSSYTYDKKGSAGTVFIQQGDQPGQLKIANIDPATSQTIESELVTEMQVVGRHAITGVQLQDGFTDRWVITTGDTLPADKNYVGYWLDLDADEDLSPYYLIVEQPGAGQVIVQTTDDLAAAGLVNKYFIGVHELETLNVQGLVTADFGEDRVIVNDIDNSVWDGTSSILAGQGSELPVQQ
jgi:hypothetical protein